MNGSLERIVFFGTPEFAVPTLDALAAASRTPLLVVSQPARPRGRGRRTEQPPVAQWAEAHDVALAQPERVRDPEFLSLLRGHAPDVAVVVAFGQIFKPELLGLPRWGCINLHASLLPRHRGAAPVQATLRAGDEVTGVTTMQMDEGLDTGPILLQREVAVEPEENAGELQARLALIGAALVVETLDQLARGALVPRPQRGELATLAPRLHKEDGVVDWHLPTRRVADLVRAMTPWPGAFTDLRGEPLRILAARPLETELAPEGSQTPGTVLGRVDTGFAVRCGDGGALVLLEVQRPGRRAVSALDFWNGERVETGERCGDHDRLDAAARGAGASS